jgi:hypothetical protein
MLIPASVSAALLDAGVTVHPRGPGEVELRTADGSTTPTVYRVERRSAVLSPSHVRIGADRPSATGGRRLLVAPSASPAALQTARDTGLSVLVTGTSSGVPASGHVIFPERTVVIAAAPRDDRTAPPARPGRRPWGTFAIARQLLAGIVDTQTGLAMRAGVTQGRVSQALSALTDLGLVDRDTAGAGWTSKDWDGLTDWWLTTYPGPGGITTYWYGLDPVRDQARTTVRRLRAHDLPVAVSGDVAADVVAPWRRPSRAVVYVDVTGAPAAADLTGAGLTPSGPAEATLELVVPADTSVWGPGDGGPPDTTGDLPLADGTQILWDLSRSPGSDTDQAVAALRATLKSAAAGRAAR